MVWPLSSPSQVQLGRGATNQRACVLRRENNMYWVPERLRAGSDRVGAPEEATVVCGEKNRQVSGPERSEPEVAGSEC